MSDDHTFGTAPGGKTASVAYLDGVHWQRLLEPSADDSALTSWLALQCSHIGGAPRGVLVSRRTGAFRPVAFWPEQNATSRFLMETVNKALTQRTDLISEHPQNADTVGIARLVRNANRIIAVIGIEVSEKSEKARQDILRRLQWGSAWIEVFERRHAGRSDEHAIERLTLALDAIAVAGEQSGFRAAATAALTSLSIQMQAARVTFGVRKLRGCRVQAVSNTTKFDRRVEQVRSIADAMNEAIDQGTEITWTRNETFDDAIVRTRTERLADQRDASCVIVQPFVRDSRPAGAMAFEWAKKDMPPPHVQEAVADVVALLAPILYDRLAEERWLAGRALSILKRHLVRLVGPGYLGRKIALAVLAATIVFFSLYEAAFRVTADARLQGAVERVVMAPIDGYIVEAPTRAGDTVEKEGLLVRFDDVEYQLERYAWIARKHQFETEYAQALAGFDRAGVNILRARIEEADAQIRLNDTRIALTRITAPFSAVIVTGDLSQSLGQSVQRGDELFRIAPLDSYVVEIEVPETDILHIEPDLSGTLVLTSLPTSAFDVTVQKVTMVTGARDGKNHFLVEARLENPSGAPVAPGMEGIVKIDAGEAKLIWIWTRRMIDWLRLQAWRWLP